MICLGEQVDPRDSEGDETGQGSKLGDSLTGNQIHLFICLKLKGNFSYDLLTSLHCDRLS
jgi:hypothetical protein